MLHKFDLISLLNQLLSQQQKINNLHFQSMNQESQTMASIKQRIAQQIQALKQYEHIKSIQKKNDYAYQLLYYPSQTKSVYKQKTYNIQLILPTTYPQDPPSLKFLDQIYHLNIGLSSGQVRMSVLEDDWSPFLSLTSLIESLDKILEEPDELYALDAQMLDEYQNNRTLYLNKVLEHVSLADVVSCYSAQRIYKADQFSDTPPNNKFTIQRPYSPNKNHHPRRSEALVQNLRESMELADMSENHSGFIDADKQLRQHQRNYPQFVQTQSIRKSHKGNLSNKEEQVMPKIDIAQSIQVPHLKRNNQRSKMPIKSKTLNENSNPLQLSKNLTLHKINQTIGIFIFQLNEIEQQMNQTKNQGIKILLRQKYDGQLEMLKELMDLSEDAKRKIVKKLKQEVYKM